MDELECEVLDVVLSSEEEARRLLDAEAIQAVKYRGEAEDTEEIKALQAKVEEQKAKIDAYVKDHTVRNFSYTAITCRKCESKLAKDYLKDDICPLCGADLRVQSVIDAENALRDKLAELERKLAEARFVNRMLNAPVLVMKK